MKTAIVLLAAVLTVPSAAHAQFGIGEAIILGKILLQDGLIAGKTAQTAISVAQQAEQMKQLAQSIDTMKYRGFTSLLWRSPFLLGSDRYGRATPWINAAMGRGSAAGAYQTATVPVPPGEWPDYYKSATPIQQQRIAAAYAWVQAADAENAAALQAIGDSTATIPSGQDALNNLLTDNFASGLMGSNPQLSQIALAQKQNISLGINAQVDVQNQQLLAHILHELILMNTRARNEAAAQLNADQAIHQATTAAVAGTDGLKSALDSFHYGE